jgi:competence protein ComEC
MDTASSACVGFEPGPVVAVIAAVAGVLVGQRLGPAADPIALLFGAVMLIAAIVVSRPRRATVAAIGVLLLAGACTQRALNGEVHSPLARLATRAPEVTVSGTLVSDPVGPAYLTSALLRVNRVSEGGTEQPVDGRVLVRATGSDAGEWRVLAEGDAVSATGILRPLEGRDRVQRWRHAVGTLSDARLVGFGAPRAPPFVVANAVRAVVLRGCTALDPVDRALLAGFLLGDVRGVPLDVSADFRASGLTHLLAVSGENVIK